MNYFSKRLLKYSRKLYSIVEPNSSNFGRVWNRFSCKDYSNQLIYNALLSNSPCMIARFGSSELELLTNYLGVKYPEDYKNITNYIKGKSPAWWWESIKVEHIKTHSGFFPNDLKNINQFCELMISDIEQVDILGSWLKEEQFFQKKLNHCKKVVLEDLEPFFSKNPWTKALENKKVLVVHPFSKTIEKQYLKREQLFENDFLPNFQLKTIQAVQSLAGEITEYPTWFSALETMKSKIEKEDFDICIIGAGAYGFPLAAHVKRMGKKAIHLAGVTQLLFGIKGNRWEDFVVWPYSNLFNEHWVRPSETEKIRDSKKVENGCYW